MQNIFRKLINNFTPFKSWFGKLKDLEILKADIIAGITGAIIVLPQGIAFATIAGLPPEYGLYTAMVTPIIAALFGSSWHLVSGPTTAISLVIFSTISGFTTTGTPEFIQLTIVLTFLAGIYQLVFGLVKLGKVVDFVSHTVVIGFTAGAAILIVTSQMKSIFGIKMPSGTHFLETWKIIFENVYNFNLYTIIVGISTLIIAIFVKKYFKKIPNLLIALILGSLIAYYLHFFSKGLTFVPAIPSKLPDFQ
ncbi:MAG: SulP family inorganic anion transporter, partial [Candidatus Gracilibacteria bacterium]|nr:SulP family inorganic anion transporter [Candidatus Gracilibacteria bacterium]